MLEHGGRLRQAAQTYSIPMQDWLDLSTGLAPWSLPFPAVPEQLWQRLPEAEDGLAEQAAHYYGAAHALPVAGTQAAIQALPRLRPPSRMGILSPCYAEHAYQWQQAGHCVELLKEADIPTRLPDLQVLVVVNPSNPTGQLLEPELLLTWHKQLASRGGWLVLDEAFMDATPEHSLAAASKRPGLIVLRSLGKFFGLAGVRLGFVLAEPKLLEALEHWLGPWAVSGPARWIGAACLQNLEAQQQQRQRLHQTSQRLNRLLAHQGFPIVGSTAFFHWLVTEQAAALHQHCAQQGILLRHFPELQGLRLGLPATEADWQRLEQALNGFRR